MEIEFHPIANVFPLMNEREFTELKNDISNHGLREPIYVFQGKIVDGRNRYLACRELGIEPVYRELDNQINPVSFILSMNLHRRHLDESQRAMVAARIANLPAGRTPKTSIDVPITQSEAAGMLNVGVASVQRAKAVITKGDKEVVDAVDAGKLAVSTAATLADLPKNEQVRLIRADDYNVVLKAARKLKREHDAATRAEKVRELLQTPRILPEDVSLYVGDCFEKCQDIPDNSIDTIITDPPYGNVLVELCEKTAMMANRILKPGGSLVVMAGNIEPDYFTVMTNAGLNYQWTLALIYPEIAPPVFARRVFSAWKPLLWFVKGSYGGRFVRDLLRDNGPDKQYHPWQQAAETMEYIIAKISNPGDTILDPFCGAGTTGVAAVKLKRKFIGIDLVEENIAITKARIGETIDNQDERS